MSPQNCKKLRSQNDCAMTKVVSNRIYFNFDRHKTKVYGQYCSCYENKAEYVFFVVVDVVGGWQEGRKE